SFWTESRVSATHSYDRPQARRCTGQIRTVFPQLRVCPSVPVSVRGPCSSVVTVRSLHDDDFHSSLSPRILPHPPRRIRIENSQLRRSRSYTGHLPRHGLRGLAWLDREIVCNQSSARLAARVNGRDGELSERNRLANVQGECRWLDLDRPDLGRK